VSDVSGALEELFPDDETFARQLQSMFDQEEIAQVKQKDARVAASLTPLSKEAEPLQPQLWTMQDNRWRKSTEFRSDSGFESMENMASDQSLPNIPGDPSAQVPSRDDIANNVSTVALRRCKLRNGGVSTRRKA